MTIVLRGEVESFQHFIFATIDAIVGALDGLSLKHEALKHQQKQRGGPNGTPTLLYSGNSRGYPSRLAYLGFDPRPPFAG